MNLTQYGLDRSIILGLRERVGEGFRVDLVFDGYKIPGDRPLITIENMQGNYERVSKLREGINATYRYQIGLHDVNSVELSKNKEVIANLFNFHRFKYFEESSDNIKGFFYCELTAVVPMPASDISKQSEFHRVYFDVEIENIKRSC